MVASSQIRRVTPLAHARRNVCVRCQSIRHSSLRRSGFAAHSVEMAGGAQLAHERFFVGVLGVARTIVEDVRVLADEDAPCVVAHAVEDDRRRAGGGQRRACRGMSA